MKKEILLDLSRDSFKELNRKNAVKINSINATLIDAALNFAFVNESCKSTEEISKSQIIYRKLEGNITEIQFNFRKHSQKFLRMLKIFSRNRKFIISFDETEEPFYGKLNKGENNLYIHDLTYDTKGAKYGYKYLTAAITGSNGIRYILDGKIMFRGMNAEDEVYNTVKWIKEFILIEVVLFDRGFGWGVIYKLQQLNLKYIVFWKKQGTWYKRYFKEMKDGEFCETTKKYKYNRDKTNFKVESKFVLIKQHEYEGKKYDWIFATNLNKKTAGKYVIRYKKRWGIETIFRVTDEIRIYTTSTNPLIRYFLFTFTCFVYNIWKLFQYFIGEEFTLANFKINLHKYLIEKRIIIPRQYDDFTRVIAKCNKIARRIS
jgi:putative transposase